MGSPCMTRYRLTIDVDEDTYRRIAVGIPIGLRNETFRAIFEDLIPAIEEGGALFLAALIDRRIRPRDYIRALRHNKEDIANE